MPPKYYTHVRYIRKELAFRKRISLKYPFEEVVSNKKTQAEDLRLFFNDLEPLDHAKDLADFEIILPSDAKCDTSGFSAATKMVPAVSSCKVDSSEGEPVSVMVYNGRDHDCPAVVSFFLLDNPKIPRWISRP